MSKACTVTPLEVENATPHVTIGPVARSVMGALAYVDLFDYPLTLPEIVRFQIDSKYTLQEIATALASDGTLACSISRSVDGFYALAGREAVFEARRKREADSLKVWRRARAYCSLLARFPFVRMIAVTGALAVDNIGEKPDIDLLIVTTQDRVWIARRLIVGLVRFARLLNDDLCPNYIISRRNLSLDQHDLFTAHELAQMVPLYGPELYDRMIHENAWARAYLPLGFEGAQGQAENRRPGIVRRLVEGVLNLRAFDRWEHWEMHRLRRKLRPQFGDSAEVVCSPDQCKGHTGLHRHWVTTQYEQRLHELDLA